MIISSLCHTLMLALIAFVVIRIAEVVDEIRDRLPKPPSEEGK